MLTSVSLAGVAARLMPRVKTAAVAAAIVLLASRGLWYSARAWVFDVQGGQQTFKSVGEYVHRRLPERAVVLTMLHSGSVRYYSGRLTVRWMFIPETGLDVVLEEFQRAGLQPYLLLTSTEVDDFKKRFARHSQFAALDWPPLARRELDLPVEIFDPANRQAALEGTPRATELIE